MQRYGSIFSYHKERETNDKREAQEVVFITQETQNDEHTFFEIVETISKGECIKDLIERQKKTRMKQETF